MKNRLVDFLAYLDIGQTKFEEKVGLPRGFVNSLKGNTTVKSVAKIRAAYPELNTDWLMFGEGPMLKSEKEPTSCPDIERLNSTIDALLRTIESQARTIESQQRQLERLNPGEDVVGARGAVGREAHG